MAKNPKPPRTSSADPPANRRRRALLALSPAALGAAGFFLSGFEPRSRAAAPDADHKSTDNSEETGLTEHRRAFYERARF